MAKANKRQALGRGLSALLDDSGNLTPSNESVVGNVVELTLDQIEVNPFQPRTNFNQEAIEDLAKSIQALGVIQPITNPSLNNWIKTKKSDVIRNCRALFSNPFA